MDITHKGELHWATLKLDTELTPATAVNYGKNIIHLSHPITRFTVGREQGHDWVIDNPCISSLHCIISYVMRSSNSNEPNKSKNSIETDTPSGQTGTSSRQTCSYNRMVVTLTDMSRNGIYVNNKLVGKGQSVSLHDDDHIHIVQSALSKHSCYNLAYYFKIHPVAVESPNKSSPCNRRLSDKNGSSVNLLGPSTQELSPTDKLRSLFYNGSVRQVLEPTRPIVTTTITEKSMSRPLPLASNMSIDDQTHIAATPEKGGLGLGKPPATPSVSLQLIHTEIQSNHDENDAEVFGTRLGSQFCTPDKDEECRDSVKMKMLAMSSFGELATSKGPSVAKDGEQSKIAHSQYVSQTPLQNLSPLYHPHASMIQQNNDCVKKSKIQGEPSIGLGMHTSPAETQIQSQAFTYSQTAERINGHKNVTLDDVYYLDKENPIGKGSFGVVYKATPKYRSTNPISGPFYAAKIINRGNLYFLATSQPNGAATLPPSFSHHQAHVTRIKEDDENSQKSAMDAAALEKSNKALKELLEMESLDDEDFQEMKQEGCICVPSSVASGNEEKLGIGNKRERETDDCNYLSPDMNGYCLNGVEMDSNAEEWLQVMTYRKKIEEFERRHHILVGQLLPQTSEIFRKYLQEKLKWKREITILRNINHSSLIRTFDVFCEKTTIAMILELAEGGTLFTVVQSIGPLPEILVKVVLYQLLQGVAYLHARGIVHRDIKLENILLSKQFSLELFKQASLELFKKHQEEKNNDRKETAHIHKQSVQKSEDSDSDATDNKEFVVVPCTTYCDDIIDIPPKDLWPDVKITDFGLSKILGCDSLYMTTMCGTPIYVAPEVTIHNLRRGLEGYTSAVDIYSLAVLSFALLTARAPFPYVKNADGSVDRTRVDYLAPLSWERQNKRSDVPCKPISDAAKELLRVMFVFQPKDRITASEALQHHWFREVREALKDENIDK